MKNGYRHTESGLTNVWLANGYTIRKTKYGEGVSIHDADGLHRALARALSNRPRLMGTEIRFLRKEMGLPQRGLGELLGVTDQAASRRHRRPPGRGAPFGCRSSACCDRALSSHYDLTDCSGGSRRGWA